MESQLATTAAYVLSTAYVCGCALVCSWSTVGSRCVSCFWLW